MVDHFNRMNLGEQTNPGMGLAQARAANAGMSVEQYNRFLQGMDGQPGVAQSSTANPFRHNGDTLVNPQSVMSPPLPRNTNLNAHPTYLHANGSMMGSGFPITHSMTPPAIHQNGPITMGSIFAQAATANSQAIHADPAAAISAKAFDEAFAEFDDGEFQHELDSWMAVHGTAAERAQQRPAKPTAEEWREIDADLKQIADAADAARAAGNYALQPRDEQEAAREEDNKLKTEQELVRAATDILASVSDNTSTKFQQSTFLELMRRIRDHEVTVVNNSLVDLETGAEIATKGSDEDASEGPGTSKFPDPVGESFIAAN